MKHKKNKNGFTLVELLITIAIITVILGIASITAINLINNSKEKSIAIAKNNILNAARMYTEEYANEIYWQENISETEKEKFSCVSINELINKNFLKKDTLEKLPSDHKYIVIWKSKNNSILSEEFDNIDYGKCQYIETNNFEIPKCEENIYYNKTEQILIKNPDTYGITLINYTATNIGLHQVTAKLRNGYKWSDGTTQDKTFNCEILAPQYKIKYNANGGTGTMEDSIHTYNEEKNLTSNSFTNDGHKFKNWNTKEDGTGTTYEDEQTILNLTMTNGEEIILYAQWESNKVFINYNTNGGTLNGTGWSQDTNGLIFRNNEILSLEIEHGKTIRNKGLYDYNNDEYLNITNIGKHGIKNAEWKCLSGCTGNLTEFSQTINTYTSSDFCDTTNGDCTIVLGVNWEPNIVTINYNTNGGTLNGTNWSQNNGIISKNEEILTLTIKHGDNIRADGLHNYNNKEYLNITKTGRHAIKNAEWECNSGCTDSSKTFDQTVNTYTSSDFCNTTNGNCTVELGVNWEYDNYTVTFDPNGGTVSPTTKEVTYNSTYGELPTPTYEGHKFNGWYTSKTGGTKITSTTKVTITANQTLYAHWTPYKVTIKYNVNGGSITPTDTTTGNWTQDENGLIYKNGNLLTLEIEHGETIRNDGLQNYNHSKYLNITKTGRHAKNDAEWECNSGCTGTFDQTVNTYTSNNFCNTDNGNCEVELGVNWEYNKYTITFNPNGGTVSPTTKEVTYNSKYETLPTPTYTGHTFNGWYTSKTGGTKITSTTKVTITANQTLYAHWTANTTTIDDTRYSCQKYNSETFYRLSTFYITTCSNGNCTFNNLNGLTSSNSNASLSIISPPVSTVSESTLESSIPSNCAGTTYYITANGGLNCRNIPNTDGSSVKATIGQCATVTIVPTTTNYTTSKPWYYNSKLNCYMAGGTEEKTWISTTKPEYCSSTPSTPNPDPEEIIIDNGCNSNFPHYFESEDKIYCCNSSQGPNTTGTICEVAVK